MTVAEYYKEFQSLYGALTGAIGITPLLSVIIPESFSQYLFPPLDDLFKIVALVLVALTTLVVFFAKDLAFMLSRRRRMRILLVTFLVCLAGGCGLLLASTAFVRKIEIPATGTTVMLSVGYDRSEFAKRVLSQFDDWEVLRQRGPYEDQVRKVWTFRSIMIARVALFTSYLLFLLSAVASGCLGVLYNGYGTAPNP